MWGMSSQIKDPEVRKAAWEYIKYMCGPKADEVRTRSYVENGLWKYVSPEKLESTAITNTFQKYQRPG